MSSSYPPKLPIRHSPTQCFRTSVPSCFHASIVHVTALICRICSLCLRRSGWSCGRRRGRCWGARRSRSRRTVDRWQFTTRNPQVYQWLHRLGVFVRQKVEESPHVDEVNEARVQLTGHVEIPDRQPMLPEQMRIAAEHLLVHVLEFALKVLWEARCATKPEVWVFALLCGWKWLHALEIACGKQGFVLDLAGDPRLDVLDVGWGWEVDGIAVRIDPGVGDTVGTCQFRCNS